MIDDRTPNLFLPLPNEDNTLLEDVERLRDAFSILDTELGAKGDPGGLAPLDGSGKVPSANLPSYVDDVVEVADFAALPATGETGKIYVTVSDNKMYRWSGSTYVSIGSTNLPPATAVVLGGVKVGAGLSVGGDGTLSVIGGGGGGSGLPAFDTQVLVPSTNGQTVFTVPGGYTVGQIEVFLNGILLNGNGDDYTATNGTTVTLTAGINTVDALTVRRWAYLPTANALNKTGDTMTGPLILAADPAAVLGAATKQYTDTKLSKAGGTLTGALTLASDPTSALHAATKQYVDSGSALYSPTVHFMVNF